MKNAIRIVVCALALFAIPAAARAQTAADSAGVLLGVATRLKAEGQNPLSRSILNLILERYPNTPAALEAQRMIDALRGDRTEQSGRTELMVFGPTYGLFLGAAIPYAADADDPEPYGVGLILGGPAGFLASRAYAKSRPLTEGQARAITFGGTWGAWQGQGWAQVFDLGASEYCYEFGCTRGDDADGNAAMAATIAGSVIGLGVGAVLSKKNITAGTATTVNFGGLWGSWFGGASAALFDSSGDKMIAATLIGGNLGIIAAALNAPKWQLSRPRARLISISGVAGLLAGFGVLLIAQPEGESSIAVPMATSAAGLALGAYWTRDMPADRQR